MPTLKSATLVLLTSLLAVTMAGASTNIVTTTADTGSGSLRTVIAGSSAGDTIVFTNTISGATITLAGTLTVPISLTIDASSLSNGMTINGGNSFQVLLVNGAVNVVLNSLTITNGANTGSGGGMDNEGGTVTLNQCTVAGSSSGNFGGGILNNGTVTLNECTLSGNSAQTYGGGVYNNGLLTLNQCTVSSNSASIVGGGIYNLRTNTLNQCTVSSNSAAIAGGGVYNNGHTNVISNSIVSANSGGTTAADIYGGAAFGGSNIVQYFANSAYTGTQPVSAAPKLAPLGHYGGPTQTMPPVLGSPAIDMGSDSAATTFATDQRGVPRRSGAHVDIGAVELQQAAPVTLAATQVTSTTAILNGTVVAGDLTNAVSFEYGTSTATSTNYFYSAPVGMVYPGNTPTSVEVGVTGLAPGTTVHYQIVANDGISAKLGGDIVFTTMGPPALSGVMATPFGGGAILNAAINPLGAATQYYFEYNVNSPGAPSFFSATNTVPAGFGPVNVSVPVSGLTSQTSYTFELVAMNSFGTSSATGGTGSPLNFTTGQVLVENTAMQFSSDVTNSSGDTITFGPNFGQTMTLNTVITLSSNITIDASGLSNGITFNGNNATQIFQVNAGAVVVLNSLIITNGNSGSDSGGGIHNNGTLTLDQCTVSGNSSGTGGPAVGGGILNVGTLTLNQCTVSGNSSDLAGGIYNVGTLTLNGCMVSGNSSGNGGGGGIANNGTLSLNQCVVSANSADDSSDGGGIVNNGTLSLNQCVVSANSSTDDGGGLYNHGALTLNQCTVSSNSSTGVVGSGGGVYNTAAGALTLNECTLSENSTVASGGGIFAAGTTTIVQCTIAGNSGRSGGGIFNDFIFATNLVISNSIVATNSATMEGLDIFGGAIVGGSNIVQSYASGPLIGPTPIDAYPNLAPLGNYGGPTQTMPPLPGSPAIDAAAPTTFTTDQRGLPRVLGAAPDIGAVEGVFNPTMSLVNPIYLGNGGFQFAFSNLDGATFSILATTNLALTSWSVLGAAVETPVGSGQYQFTDLPSTNYPQRFYRVTLP